MSSSSQQQLSLKDIAQIEKTIMLHSEEAVLVQFSVYSEGEEFNNYFRQIRENLNKFYTTEEDKGSLHDILLKFKASSSFYEYEGEIIELLGNRFGISYRNENHTQKLMKLNKFIKKHMNRLTGKELRKALAVIDEHMIMDQSNKRFEVTFSKSETILDHVDACIYSVLQLAQTLKYIQCVLLEIAQEIYQKLNIVQSSNVLPWMIFLSITARLYSVVSENIQVIHTVYENLIVWSRFLPTRQQIASYLSKDVSIVFVTKNNREGIPSVFPMHLSDYLEEEGTKYKDLSQFLLNEYMKQDKQELLVTIFAKDAVTSRKANRNKNKNK